MKFETLLGQLKKLDLPEGQYIVVGSGPLAAKGIRESHDFDILVTWDLWTKLKQKYPLSKTEPVENIDLGDIQILGHGSMFRRENIATIDEIMSTAEIIDGVKFLNLKLLKQFKLDEGREKDLKDVELIDNYIAQAKK